MSKLLITAVDLANGESLVVTLSDGSCRIITPEMVQAIAIFASADEPRPTSKDHGCLDGTMSAKEQNALQADGFNDIPV